MASTVAGVPAVDNANYGIQVFDSVANSVVPGQWQSLMGGYDGTTTSTSCGFSSQNGGGTTAMAGSAIGTAAGNTVAMTTGLAPAVVPLQAILTTPVYASGAVTAPTVNQMARFFCQAGQHYEIDALVQLTLTGAAANALPSYTFVSGMVNTVAGDSLASTGAISAPPNSVIASMPDPQSGATATAATNIYYINLRGTFVAATGGSFVISAWRAIASASTSVGTITPLLLKAAIRRTTGPYIAPYQ